jgi:hypothetical protein
MPGVENDLNIEETTEAVAVAIDTIVIEKRLTAIEIQE